jgi:hypothetical protein
MALLRRRIIRRCSVASRSFLLAPAALRGLHLDTTCAPAPWHLRRNAVTMSPPDRSAPSQFGEKTASTKPGALQAAWTPEPEVRLADLERDIVATRQQLTDARARIATLKAERLTIPTTEPAQQAGPAEQLTQERNAWRARRSAEQAARRARQAHATTAQRPIHVPPPPPSLGPRPGGGPRMGR